MISILFKKHSMSALSGVGVNGYIIHAHPGCTLFNIEDIKEYYLENYGSDSEGLEKINMREVVELIKANKRVDLL